MLKFTPQRAYLAVCDDTGAYIVEWGARYVLVYKGQKFYWLRESTRDLEVLEKAQLTLDKLIEAEKGGPHHDYEPC